VTICTSEAVVPREPEVIGRASNPRGGRTLRPLQGKKRAATQNKGMCSQYTERGQPSTPIASCPALSPARRRE